jgi:hypothetical protein
LLLEALDWAVLGSRDAIRLGEWVKAAPELPVPSQGQIVISLGNLDSEVPSIELLGHQRARPSAVERIENKLALVGEQGNQASHQPRRKLTGMIYPSGIVLQPVDVPPKVRQFPAVGDALEVALGHACGAKAVELSKRGERFPFHGRMLPSRQTWQRCWLAFREAKD